MTKISATLFTGAILCQVVLGIDFWLSLPFLIFAAGAYTYTGGLKAVIYTEVAQMIIFTLGGILTSAIILTRVGGIQTMFQHFSSNPHTADFPHLIRPLESEFSWLGMFIGQFMSSMWYWCLDQESKLNYL